LVQTYTVPDAAAFPRTLLIEALGRAGVTVDAQTVGPNPSANLPPSSQVGGLPQVAEYVSPPYSEYARLTNKVSHNLGANLIPALLAVKHGQRTYEAGMEILRTFVREAGIDPSLFTLVDAQGLCGRQVRAGGTGAVPPVPVGSSVLQGLLRLHARHRGRRIAGHRDTSRRPRSWPRIRKKRGRSSVWAPKVVR
jgi:hypothetical protein